MGTTTKALPAVAGPAEPESLESPMSSFVVTGDNTSYIGSPGNDTLSATGSGDTIFGSAGSDLISAQGAHGYAYLVGGNDPNIASGFDTIIGSGFNDRIVSGSSNFDSGVAVSPDHSVIFAGAGDDVIQSYGHDTIYANQGNDVINGGTLASTIFGGQGDDQINIANDSLQNSYISGDAGNDYISATQFKTGATIFGGDGDDSIYAGLGHNIIFGNAGNDQIQGGQAPETIFAGQGNDSIDAGQAENSYLSGDAGNDIISASTQGGDGLHGLNDTLVGGLGDDRLGAAHASIFGNQGNDIINGGDGSTIFGGQGDDMIGSYQQLGGNLLYGDAGADTIVSGQLGGDTVSGGSGADEVTLPHQAGGSGDRVVIGVGDSKADTSTIAGVGTEANLDRVFGFSGHQGFGDIFAFAGHKDLVVSDASHAGNLTVYIDPAAASATELTAYQAAYLYAYGDGTSAHLAHTSTEYLAVQESYIEPPVNLTASVTYVFTADHVGLALDHSTAAQLSTRDIVAG